MKTAILALAGSTTAISNAATRYCSLAGAGGSTGWVTASSSAATPVAIAGTVGTLYIRMGTALLQGSWVFTLQKNGADTAVTCTIDSVVNTQVNFDLVNTVSVAVGDTLNIKAVPSGTPTAQLAPAQLSLMLTSTVAGESALFAKATGASTAGFLCPGQTQAGNAAEANASGTMPTAGAISKIYVALDTASGAGTSRTFTLRKNGADTGLTVTLSNATTGNATGTSVAFVAGDVISIGQTISGVPAASNAMVGLNWLPTTDGEGVDFGNFASSISTSATRFANFDGSSSGGEATETNTYNIAPIALTVGPFRTDLQAAPGAGKSRAFTVRKTGVDTAATVTLTTGTTATYSGAVVAFAAGDLIDVAATVPIANAAATTWARMSAVVIVTGGSVLAFSPGDVGGQTFEGVRGTSAVAIKGTYGGGTPTSVQVRLVDNVGAQVAAWTTASSQGAGAYAHTFSGVAIGGPYYHQVRDNGGTATNSSADLYVGAVVVLWGQSQCEKLFTVGTSTLTPTCTNVRVLTTSDKTNAGVAVYTITLLNSSTPATAGITGSGIVGIANQWHADVGASVPLLIVFTAYQGTSIEYWLSDRAGNYPTIPADTTTLWGTTPTTGLAWGMANAAKFQASGIVLFQGTSDVANYATYAASQASLKTKFEALYPAMTPLILVAPHPRSDDGANTWNMRSAQYGNAISGGTWRLCCWLLDWQLDGGALPSPHEIDGATGTIRGGTRFGRGIAKHLNNTALDVVGPQVSTAAFTDTNRNVIEITYNKTVKLANGTGYTGSPVTLPPQLYSISTNSGSTFGNPGSGFTAALTATNKVQLTKTSTAWSQSTTRIDYLRGTPFSADTGNTADYVGTETNMETDYLGKVLTDGSAFDSNRGMPASPIMATGFAASEASTGGAVSGTGLYLGMRLGL